MRVCAWCVGVILTMAGVGNAFAEEFKRVDVSLGARAVNVWAANGQIGVQLENGWTLGFGATSEGVVKQKAPAKPKSLSVPTGGLPDGVMARGKGEIRKAWLIQPVQRYAHGVLGDRIEAGGVRVETAKGRQLSYILPQDEVFEDRHARIADLDGDGRDEIIVVNSHLRKGAALAVLGVRGGKLVRLARTPFIGTANRWLNPAGIADFDLDGSKEVAIVVTPHIGGTLQFWNFAKGKLTLQAERFGFSNHFIGSRIQDMSTVLPMAAKGKPRLVLPNADRRALLGVSLAGKQVAVNWTQTLPAKVVTQIIRTKTKNPAIAAGLSDHSLFVLHSGHK